MNKKYDGAIFRQDTSKPTVNVTAPKIVYGFNGKVVKSSSADKAVSCYSEGSKRYVCVDSTNHLVDPHKKHNKEEAKARSKKRLNTKTKLVEVEVACFDYYLHYLQTQTEAFLRMAQQKVKNHRGGTGVVTKENDPFDSMSPATRKKMGIHKLA
jgi:hypothetical protein